MTTTHLPSVLIKRTRQDITNSVSFGVLKKNGRKDKLSQAGFEPATSRYSQSKHLQPDALPVILPGEMSGVLRYRKY